MTSYEAYGADIEQIRSALPHATQAYIDTLTIWAGRYFLDRADQMDADTTGDYSDAAKQLREQVKRLGVLAAHTKAEMDAIDAALSVLRDAVAKRVHEGSLVPRFDAEDAAEPINVHT